MLANGTIDIIPGPDGDPYISMPQLGMHLLNSAMQVWEEFIDSPDAAIYDKTDTTVLKATVQSWIALNLELMESAVFYRETQEALQSAESELLMSYKEKPEGWDDPYEPRCDGCGVSMEDTADWCSNCGACSYHCSNYDGCGVEDD